MPAKFFKYQVGDIIKLAEPHNGGESSSLHPDPRGFGTIVKQETLGGPGYNGGFDHTYHIQWDRSSQIDTAGWFEWALELVSEHTIGDAELLAAKRKWDEFFNASS